MQKSKMAVWGGLTNTCEKKRSERQRRKGKIYPFECRVPGGSQEELPHFRGQGQRTRVPGCNGAGMAERNYTMSKARGCGREDLSHARSQGPQPGGATQPPRSSGCAGAGGPRGAILPSRSEQAAVKRYPSSKVRSSSCTLLEQP